MKKILSLFTAFVLLIGMTTMVLATAANVSFDLDEETLSATLDTGNDVLIGEGTLDLTNGETTESHCLDTEGHTSGDLC